MQATVTVDYCAPRSNWAVEIAVLFTFSFFHFSFFFPEVYWNILYKMRQGRVLFFPISERDVPS